jgi:hypothetical protein
MWIQSPPGPTIQPRGSSRFVSFSLHLRAHNSRLTNMLRFLFNTILTVKVASNDAPHPWQMGFQDGGTPSFEGIIELHDQIMFYLIVILLGVAWMLSSTIRKFNSYHNQIVHKYHNHGLKGPSGQQKPVCSPHPLAPDLRP